MTQETKTITAYGKTFIDTRYDQGNYDMEVYQNGIPVMLSNLTHEDLMAIGNHCHDLAATL